MSLPPTIVRFLRACDGLSPVCATYAWGSVTRDVAVPRVHDANHAWVYDTVSPSIDELRAAMESAQTAAAVPYTHVEVVDTASRPRVVDALTQWLGPPPDVFALMAISSTAPPAASSPPAGSAVVEQAFPSHDRWLALIAAGHADAPALPADVVEQLASRDISIFAPAGRGFFALERDGDVLAYASLLSMAEWA